jgi:hypothetical protein
VTGNAEVARYELTPVPDLSNLDWDTLVQIGRQIAYAGQWVLGDLATQVGTVYGEHSLEKYADEIGVEYDTLRRYRDISRAFPETATRGAQPWSVHRVLAAQPDRLKLVSGERMTVAQALDLVSSRYGKPARQQTRAAERAQARRLERKIAADLGWGEPEPETAREVAASAIAKVERITGSRRPESAPEPVMVPIVIVQHPHCPTCTCFDAP